MRTYKKLLSIVSLVCIIALASFPVTASGVKVKMSDMHYVESEEVKTISESITDSYGNTYSNNIVDFSAGSNASITYDLNGAYELFEATIVCSDNASSNALIDVGIFADGVLVYSLKDYGRQLPAENVSLDVSGVGKLSIKTIQVNGSYDYIYFVNAYFTKSNTSTIYPTRGNLSDLVLIDSSDNCRLSNDMVLDAFGELHNGYVFFNVYGEGYALFNLNGAYETFCGTVVPLTDCDTRSVASVKFYVDDVEIYSQSEIVKTSSATPFELSVSKGKVLKIVITGDDDHVSRIMITDTLLKVHEHVLSEWETVLDPTCTTPGKRRQTCTLCGKEIYSEDIPPLGHKPDGKWETSRDATCSVTGVEVQHCSVCHEVCETRPIPVIPHTPNKMWEDEKDPTCVEQGSMVKRCSECGEVVEREYIDVIDHDFGDWKTVSGNIWNNPIVRERTCSMCGEVEREESSPTSWLKPLVVVIFIILIGGLITIGITLKMNNLPLSSSSIKKLFKKDPLTDDEIEKLINKPDTQTSLVTEAIQSQNEKIQKQEKSTDERT